MIELLFFLGVASQMVFLLLRELEIKVLGIPIAEVATGTLLAFGTFIALFVPDLPIPFLLRDALLTTSAVIGLLFAIALGFGTFKAAQRMSIIPVLVFHLFALLYWSAHEELHRFFAFDLLLWWITPLLLSIVVPYFRKWHALRGVAYLWLYALLLFFTIRFFSPLTEVFEPSLTQALLGGALLVPMALYSFFGIKLAAMVGTSLVSKDGRQLLGTFLDSVWPPNFSLFDLLYAVLSICLFILHAIGTLELHTLMELLLLLFFFIYPKKESSQGKTHSYHT